MFQSPGTIAFKLGSIPIHWYGVIIGIGILLAYFYSMSECRRRNLKIKHIDNMAFWVILAGVLGSRLYFVIFNMPYFWENPAEILQIWKGGLAIHGALIGGALAYFIYIWRSKISPFLYADVVMPGVLLAQALGRWGNFFNSEAFGRPTDLPWKLFIPEASRPTGYEDFSYFHPTFLYESLWNFAGFLFLVWLTRRIYHTQYSIPNTQHSGSILCAYLIWYSFGRFFIESLRTDSLYLGPFRAAQLVSVLLFLMALIGLLFLHRKHKIGIR